MCIIASKCLPSVIALVFVTVARQMRTINYMLSSQRCMDEGWTIRPPSPVLDVEPNVDIFEPLLPTDGDGKVSVNLQRVNIKMFNLVNVF